MATGSSERMERIIYPSMQELYARSVHDLRAYRMAVEELIRFAYGDCHSYLTVAQRNERLQLYKLSNLLERLALVDDVPVMEWGHRCPDQLRSYDIVLRSALPLAYRAGLGQPYLGLLDEMHERLWQVLQMVTWQSDALS